MADPHSQLPREVRFLPQNASVTTRRPGSARTHRGSLRLSPYHLAGFNGWAMGRERDKVERKGKDGRGKEKGKGGKFRSHSSFQISVTYIWGLQTNRSVPGDPPRIGKRGHRPHSFYVNWNKYSLTGSTLYCKTYNSTVKLFNRHLTSATVLQQISAKTRYTFTQIKCTHIYNTV